MKLSVTGSRHWPKDAKDVIYATLSDISPRPTVIIHGGAKGVDTWAALWAKQHRIPCAVVAPVQPWLKWSYLDRNTVIVDLGDKTLAFRADGESDGTDDTIAKAEAAGKLLSIVRLGVVE